MLSESTIIPPNNTTVNISNPNGDKIPNEENSQKDSSSSDKISQ